MLANLPLVIA